MVASNGSTVTHGGTGASGHPITLNILVPRDNISQSMQFDVQTAIGEVCRAIREHLPTNIGYERKATMAMLFSSLITVVSVFRF